MRCLLMGGQACILYGAAEFSRDADFTILADADNLARLTDALSDLEAHQIAVPPLTLGHLKRGHAVHYRCGHPDAAGLRVDLMSVMRGVAPFDELWERRATVSTEPGEELDVISLPDLVQAKKTQRDKDWPMLRLLVERHYFEHRGAPSDAQISFWLSEMRSPQLLIQVANAHRESARSLAASRPLLDSALTQDVAALETALRAEEDAERALDRAYWEPLRRELEALRHP